MENKRAFLLGEETVKIVIAVISIVILIGLVAGLYMIYVGQQETMQAKATIEKLAEAINNNYSDFIAYNPRGWYITAWPVLDGNQNSFLPNECIIHGWKNCVCMTDVSNFVISSGVNKKYYDKDIKPCAEVKTNVSVIGFKAWIFYDTQALPIPNKGIKIERIKENNIERTVLRENP